ncbi:hypothetical protein PG991_014630 [Apiospora marii]|uniref:F-box domain-containing protein n=1 Tax=Apiospora marii TaxID=335849 RepID=A0ABR1R3Z5_9PEZI
MQFSELPPEIIHEILIACVRSRHIQRALRLRHVSRAWDVAVVRAVFASGVLDDDPYCIFIEWPRYLAYRATGSAARRIGWPRPFFVLRRVAERLVDRRDAGSGGDPGDDAVDDCVGELCATMEPGSAFRMPPGFNPSVGDPRRPDDEPTSEDDDQLLQALLSVAAARNDVAFVKDLLQKVHDRPRLVYSNEYPGLDDNPNMDMELTMSPRPLFRYPLEEAAFAGHDESVHVLLDFMSATSDDEAAYRAKESVFWDACRGGQLSTLEIVFESMREVCTEWDELLMGTMDEVADVGVFKRLYSSDTDFIDAEKSEDEESKDELLCRYLCLAARKGAMPLMEHLIELGATPENPVWSGGSDQEDPLDQEDSLDQEDPLDEAVTGGHTEAVTYLLEKGFRPRDYSRTNDNDCLIGAVDWDNPRLVELILLHLNRESPNFGKHLVGSLEMAMQRENERILSMLLTFGSTAFTDKAIRKVMYHAETLGLDSMAHFLQGYLPADDNDLLLAPLPSTGSESSGSDIESSGSE